MMLINLIYAILPIISMIIGFYFGFNIQKEKELPKIKTPVEMIEQHKEKRKEKESLTQTEVYLENIDNYPNNQKEV